MSIESDQNVEVKSSAISGCGVFAKRDFQKGEVILMWDTSHKVRDEDVATLPEADTHFLVRFQGGWIIMQEPMRYVNHSCDANTRADDGKDVAIRSIHAGEEITSDYRPEMKKGERMECHCGASNCLGYIIGTGA